jgi:hypothetical protein
MCNCLESWKGTAAIAVAAEEAAGTAGLRAPSNVGTLLPVLILGSVVLVAYVSLGASIAAMLCWLCLAHEHGTHLQRITIQSTHHNPHPSNITSLSSRSLLPFALLLLPLALLLLPLALLLLLCRCL